MKELEKGVCRLMPSLYVHVPFCVQKCDYCGFYSQSLRHSSRELTELYLQSLEMEMEKRQKDTPGGVSSLFIGGGTPTALTANELELLLELLRRYTYLKSEPGKKPEHENLTEHDNMTERENTIEGNPGTLTKEKLACLRRYGINRFSLGVQSFQDEMLRNIGRIHTAEEARLGIKLLREAGFDNLNLDLMFGLPGQDMPAWQADVEESLTFGPEHLSLYGLILEEGTPMYRRYTPETGSERLPALPDDDLQADMYALAAERLEQAGYRHYETSNFALPGYACRHNLGYWRGEDYLGLGPGAVSCRHRTRWKNIESITNYNRFLTYGREPIAEESAESLSLEDCMAERAILGLRLEEGVNLASFRRDFGVDFGDVYGDVLVGYLEKGIFIRQGEFLCLAKPYAFVANSILEAFVKPGGES